MSIRGGGSKFDPQNVRYRPEGAQPKCSEDSLSTTHLGRKVTQLPPDNKSSLLGRFFKSVINSSTKILKKLTPFGSVINNPKGVEESGLKVIASLKEGLRTLTPGDISPPTPKNALKVFQAFANAISESGLKATDHVAIYGQLAARYFDLAEQSFNIDDLYNEGKLSFKEAEIETNLRRQFINEITIRENNGDCSFEWFSLYCDRLTILMTEPAIRTSFFSAINVRFDYYRNQLAQGDWRSHEGYMRTCKTVCGKYAGEKASPLARSHVDYPDVIMLPYPFELDAKQIFETTPGLKGNHFWPLGYVLRPCPGDGILMSPLTFMGHDDFHWRNINQIIDQKDLYYAVCKNTPTPSDEELKNHSRKGRELFGRCIEVIAKVLESPNKDPDRIKMDNFFAFYLTHETTNPLVCRLSDLTGIPLPISYTTMTDYGKSRIQLFRDDRYFKSSLPPNMVEKVDLEDGTAFGDAFKEYALKFVESFHTELKELEKNINRDKKGLVDEVGKWADFYNLADLKLTNEDKFPITHLDSVDLLFFGQHKVFPAQRHSLPQELVQKMQSPKAYWKNAGGETLVMPSEDIIHPEMQLLKDVELQLKQQGYWLDGQGRYLKPAEGTAMPYCLVRSDPSDESRYLIQHGPGYRNHISYPKLSFAYIFKSYDGDLLATRQFFLEHECVMTKWFDEDVHVCDKTYSLDDTLREKPKLNIVMQVYGRDRIEIKFRDDDPCERVTIAANELYKLMDPKNPISSLRIRQKVTEILRKRSKNI